MVETPAELPFIEDRVVCLSHNQAARSGQVTLSSGVGDRNPTLFGSGYTSRGPARDNWPRRVGADWHKHIRSLFPLSAANDRDSAAIGTDNIHLRLTLARSLQQTPLEGTGFEPSVPLL